VLSGNNAGLLGEAQVLAAQITAFRSGDVSALAALAENPGYAEYRAALHYTRWKISGDNRYKSRLLAEYPESPEARIAGGEGGAYGAVSAAPLALWFLFPGRENVTLAPPAAAAEGPTVLIIPAAPPPPVPEEVALQIGLFSREENARAMAERLTAAGFQAAIIRRTLKGAGYWAVTVPAGNDMGRTIIQLKDAGFQSFPVF
jgi:hypothetical protein